MDTFLPRWIPRVSSTHEFVTIAIRTNHQANRSVNSLKDNLLARLSGLHSQAKDAKVGQIEITCMFHKHQSVDQIKITDRCQGYQIKPILLEKTK